MHKLGDVREDGKIFMQKSPNSVGGEYWVTKEHFLRVKGKDYYEMRSTRDSYVPMSKEEKREKGRIWASNRSESYKESRKDRVKDLSRESYLRNKDKDSYKQRMREAARRHYIKHNAEKVEYTRIRKEQIVIEKEAKRLVVESRKAEIARKKASVELAKLLRPARVLLTDEQRKDRKRDEKRNYKHRRRAIIRGLEVKATPKELREAKAKAKGKCFYCSGKFLSLTLDHVIAIAKGGGHTLDNIVWACHGCNSAKRDLPAHEFAGQFGMLIV